MADRKKLLEEAEAEDKFFRILGRCGKIVGVPAVVFVAFTIYDRSRTPSVEELKDLADKDAVIQNSPEPFPKPTTVSFKNNEYELIRTRDEQGREFLIAARVTAEWDEKSEKREKIIKLPSRSPKEFTQKAIVLFPALGGGK